MSATEIRSLNGYKLIDEVARRRIEEISNNGGSSSGGGLPTGGEPNMVLVTDADGNAKWEERTHYTSEELVDVVPRTTLLRAHGAYYYMTEAFEIIEGKTYEVEWNGTLYSCVAAAFEYDGETGYTIGSTTEDGEEPFLISKLTPKQMEVFGAPIRVDQYDYDGSNTDVIIRIRTVGTVYHKLAPEFLPIPMTVGTGDVLPEMALEGEEGTLPILTPFASEIVVGKTYTVTYNGTDYICTAFPVQEGEGSPTMPSVGNQAAIGGENTGEPFVIAYVPPEMVEMAGGMYGMVLDMTGASSATIKIQGEGVVKIDNSALDLDWIPKKESVGATILPTISFVGTTNVPVLIYDKINLGSTYVVLFDGVRYECVAQDYMGVAKLLGNPNVMGITNIPGRGEPFCVGAFAEAAGAQVAENDTAPHEVAVYEKGNTQKVANVLPSEFMPSGVMRSLCIMSSNYTAWLNGDDISENPTYTANMGASGVVKALEAGELSNVCLYEYNGVDPCVFHSVGILIAADTVHILMSYRYPLSTSGEQLRKVEIAYGDITVTEVT